MKSLLLISHLLAVIAGVGGALLLDIYLLRHLRGNVILPGDVAFASFVEKFVKIGLIGVWGSGILILAYAPDGPASVFANPKVQAKLVIVVVLTLNALFIETLALPTLRANVGRCLFDGVGELRQALLITSAAVSSTSWLAPFVLGIAKELNHVIPAKVIVLTYGWVVASAALGAQIAVHMIYRPDRKHQRQPLGTADHVPTLQSSYHSQARHLIEATFSTQRNPIEEKGSALNRAA